MAAANNTVQTIGDITIDTSDVNALMRRLRTIHSEENMKKLMERAIRRTGSKVKTIVKKDVPKKYHITSAQVGKDIKTMQMGNAAQGPACTIPIIGVRHIIGGKTFRASGGRHGWNGIKAGKRYKIKTQIIKGQTVSLPTEMKDLGGNPPFRNLSAKRLSSATFTRAAGAGFPPKNTPIRRVVGIATPQMPLNRSEAEVQEDIVTFLAQRMEHEHAYIMAKLGR